MKMPLRCTEHPMKPASQMCKICKRGFCKYHTLKHDGNGFICDDCRGGKDRNRIQL